MPGVDYISHVSIASPLATILSEPTGIQENVTCRDMQMRYINCIIEYGYYRAYKDCRAHYDDFIECMYHGKRISRATMIAGENKRQKGKGIIREYLKPPFTATF